MPDREYKVGDRAQMIVGDNGELGTVELCESEEHGKH